MEKVCFVHHITNINYRKANEKALAVYYTVINYSRHSLIVSFSDVGSVIIGSLPVSNHDNDGNKNPTNLHNLLWKTVFLHALRVHFPSFDILKTFSFFLRREMTCFAVV